MKVLIILIASIVLVAAESPRSKRFRSNKFARQEAAPYQPSGWTPSGQQFKLPERQTAAKQTYGSPLTSYGTPSQAEPPVEPESENIESDSSKKSERLKGPKSGKVVSKPAIVTPVYYILPQTPLQNLIFAPSSQGLQYFANLQTQPLQFSSPIVYAPQNVQQW